MLGNASGFAAGNIGFADGVEQRRLAMIDVAHDGDHRGTWNLVLVGVCLREDVFDGFVGHLVLKGDDLGVGSELAGDILDEFAIERLIHGDEDATQQQHGDEILAAHSEFLGKILDADALRHRDGAGDGQRLSGNLGSAEARWRSEALHRAFLGLGILLAATACVATCGTLRTRRFARRRHQAWSSSGSGTLAKAGARPHAWALAEAGTCTGCSAGRRAARGVHGTACAGGSRSSAGCSTHAGALAGASAGTAIENGPTALNPSGTGYALRRDWNRRGRRGGWCGIDRTRAGLRHDHATRRGSGFYRDRGGWRGSELLNWR